MISKEAFKELSVANIKGSDPKDYITLMSHALRLGALYKAKFFMWLENNNYELIAQDEEILEHFIKEALNVHKKAYDEAEESEVYFADNIFYEVLKETNKFSEADCVSLSLVLLAFVSFKSDLISNEEYLEIRDLLVPYKVMISQCKCKAKDLFDIYKKQTEESDGNTKLLCKLGKGIETSLPGDDIILSAFEEITYDEKSWEKE
ncbi:MAG: hypothetical protein IKZ76_00995 [Lachnospiraceae bacterium]|nr:hypothetical protein [Lachnospiraceae bacterium]MBR5916637.1 hypothetical protein [Lachnospiraceae bacterium]